MRTTEDRATTQFLSLKGGALDDRITQYKLNRKHVFEEFNSPPLAQAFRIANGTRTYAAPTGATGDENLLIFNENVFTYHILGAGQTILAPVVTGVGLDIGLDQTDDEGMELSPILSIDATTVETARRLRGIYVVGTDAAFFVRAKIKVADISGTDDLCLGFRKAELYRANVDDYDEAAYLQVGGGAAGRFNTETILNNGATTTTNLGLTVWADGETHELEVRVSAGGAVTYRVDGAAPTAAVGFTFDSGEILVPFLYFLHSADVAGLVEVIEFEYGHLSTRER